MRLLATLVVFTFASAVSCTNTRNRNPRLPQCIQEGFFKIVGSCRKYYECYKWDDYLYSRPYMCDSDKFFDEETSACKSLSLSVHLPPECGRNPTRATSPIPLTAAPPTASLAAAAAAAPTSSGVDNSLNSPEDENSPLQDSLENGVDGLSLACNYSESTNDTDEDPVMVGNCTLANNAAETENVTTTTEPPQPDVIICDYIRVVSNHATLFRTPPLRTSLEHQTEFNKLVQRYNVILDAAQNNTVPWRTGESIVSAIKNMYDLAFNYKTEFDRKYDIYQKQISKPLDVEGLVQKLQEDIREIKEEIAESEETLSLTASPRLKKFFAKSIASKKQELAEKEQELAKSSKEARDLEELLYFLGLVKNDANRIENLGKATQSRLENLNASYSEDIQSLRRFAQRVNTSIHILGGREDDRQAELDEGRENIVSIDTQKERDQEEISELNEKNAANLNKMRQLQQVIDEKIEAFNKKVKILCRENGPIKLKLPLFPTEEEKQQACNDILALRNVRLETHAEQQEIQNLVDENSRNRLRIETILAGQSEANQNIIHLLNKEPVLFIKIREAKNELGNLRFLYEDLGTLITSSKDAIESLSIIKEEFQKKYLVYEDMAKSFALMQIRAESAVTNEERLEAKEAIEEELSGLQSDMLGKSIENLGTCTLE